MFIFEFVNFIVVGVIIVGDLLIFFVVEKVFLFIILVLLEECLLLLGIFVSFFDIVIEFFKDLDLDINLCELDCVLLFFELVGIVFFVIEEFCFFIKLL